MTLSNKKCVPCETGGKKLEPPRIITLEAALEFLADDELVEVTPTAIRLRKRHLKAHERKKASRKAG